MRCRLCQSADVTSVPFAVPPDRGTWFRCRACGSDTNPETYDRKLYVDLKGYVAGYGLRDMDALRLDCRTNCEWYDGHALVKHGRDFLDIGCATGAVMAEMDGRGWTSHGFDVANADVTYPVVVRPYFHRWWWDKRFAAVMAREVFEHVPNPEMFLHECHGVLQAGGLFQIQTPRPLGDPYDHVYGRGHLFIASPERLKALLAEAMFDVIDERHWNVGQAYLCRAR